MSEQITLPPDFEFFRRVRPFAPGEIATLKPLCEKYAAWKGRHNGGRPPLDADAARELNAIYDALEEWGMQQNPPFIRASKIERRLPERRRRKVVAKLLKIAGQVGARVAAQVRQTPAEGIASDSAEGEQAPATPRGPGRKRRYDAQRDKAIAEEWRSARSAGIQKIDFVRNNNCAVRSIKELNLILNRHRKRLK